MKKLFLCALSLFSVSSFADSEVQTWLQLLSQGKITNHLRVWAEVQPRYSFAQKGLTTYMLRPAVGWQITPELSAWGGYAYTPLVKPTPRDEHRIFTQAIYALAPLALPFTQRLRIEGRFIENVPDTAIRLRYQARLVVPVALDRALNVAVYDEIMFNLNSAAPAIASGYDQNRLFAGIFYKFSPQFGLDAGYMWNAVKRATPDNRANHVLMISFYNWFDLVGAD